MALRALNPQQRTEMIWNTRLALVTLTESVRNLEVPRSGALVQGCQLSMQDSRFKEGA
jgi:hypothetical protein